METLACSRDARIFLARLLNLRPLQILLDLRFRFLKRAIQRSLCMVDRVISTSVGSGTSRQLLLQQFVGSEPFLPPFQYSLSN